MILIIDVAKISKKTQYILLSIDFKFEAFCKKMKKCEFGSLSLSHSVVGRFKWVKVKIIF